MPPQKLRVDSDAVVPEQRWLQPKSAAQVDWHLVTQLIDLFFETDYLAC